MIEGLQVIDGQRAKTRNAVPDLRVDSVLEGKKKARTLFKITTII